MEAVERVNAETKPRHPLVTVDGLKHALANLTLAASFFVAALPAANQQPNNLANTIWIVGAIIMGVFSLVRLPPRVVTIDVRSIAATAGMLVLPCMMRPTTPSTAWLALGGVMLELIGVTLTQVARIYMGQHFGLLPANRGIVTRGPFALVRHPIYMGWIIMCAGYSMSFPSARNAVLIAVALPFMMWRIEQEESLLDRDPEFVAYRNRVRYRLVPRLI